MRTCQSFRCLFWAMLYCVLYLVTATEEDLMDFDFADLKEIDWSYNDNDDNLKNSNNDLPTLTSDEDETDTNQVTFDDSDLDEENQVHPFDWRERVLRIALSKALTNSALRQKFVEVMPILRVLSSQQRLALSALISAQVNARQGQELKLQQVRMMFGNDKKLLLPIVYDIANLVRNSARKYLPVDPDFVHEGELKAIQTPISKRKFELTDVEVADEEFDDLGTLPAGTQLMSNDAAEASLEEFFADMPEDVLDPQSINEELQAIKNTEATTKATSTTSTTTTSKTTTTTTTKPTTLKAQTTTTTKPKTTTKPTQTASTTQTVKLEARQRRRRRSAEATDFVHKLIRSIPLSVNEDDLVRGAAGRTMKLNMTVFAGPHSHNEVYEERNKPTKSSPTPITTTTAGITIVTPSPTALSDYQQIEDLAFASLNSSEITLSESLAKAVASTGSEPLPNPEELIAGPRYRIVSGGTGGAGGGNGGSGGSNHVRLMRPKVVAKRKRVQLRMRPKSPLLPAAPTGHGLPKKCERFTASMCIQAEDYPL